MGAIASPRYQTLGGPSNESRFTVSEGTTHEVHLSNGVDNYASHPITTGLELREKTSHAFITYDTLTNVITVAPPLGTIGGIYEYAIESFVSAPPTEVRFTDVLVVDVPVDPCNDVTFSAAFGSVPAVLPYAITDTLDTSTQFIVHHNEVTKTEPQGTCSVDILLYFVDHGSPVPYAGLLHPAFSYVQQSNSQE